MKMHKQHGLTLVGFIIVLSVVLFFSFMGMKIVPLYMEYYAVVTAMDEMSELRGYSKRTPTQIRYDLTGRLYVSYSSNVKANHIKITRSNGLRMRVVYEVRKSLIGNLDIVAKFDNSVKLPD